MKKRFDIENIRYELDECSIEQAIKNLEEIKKERQDEFEDLQLSVEVEDDYGCFSAIVMLSGVREENKYELEQIEKYKAGQKQRELDTLKTLKEKYE